MELKVAKPWRVAVRDDVILLLRQNLSVFAQSIAKLLQISRTSWSSFEKKQYTIHLLIILKNAVVLT
jgi:DNA-binding XRE family transcriptional regulator